MVTEPARERDLDAVFDQIEQAMARDHWDGRLSVIEFAAEMLRDLPTERTVERLVEVMDRVAQDSKWEVRRAAIPVLVEVGRPAARSIIERLVGDDNRWVRQAAERAKRKLNRIATPAEKQDKRARFAFEAIKDLAGTSPQMYEAAIRVGENHYEELAGDTAHELNTYRAAMEGLLQELEFLVAGGTATDPSVKAVFSKIRDRSRYLKALVCGLLDYSRDSPVDFQVHELGPIITEALALAREKTAAALGNEVKVRFAVPDDAQLESCRERVLQALTNILSNAFESLTGKKAGAQVAIGVQVNGAESLTITITDTGTGMDAPQVENATKRFRSLKKAQGGIGLGLPLAVKIIEREHGGRLEITSAPGVGTTVTIVLPTKRGIP